MNNETQRFQDIQNREKMNATVKKAFNTLDEMIVLRSVVDRKIAETRADRRFSEEYKKGEEEELRKAYVKKMTQMSSMLNDSADTLDDSVQHYAPPALFEDGLSETLMLLNMPGAEKLDTSTVDQIVGRHTRNRAALDALMPIFKAKGMTYAVDLVNKQLNVFAEAEDFTSALREYAVFSMHNQFNINALTKVSTTGDAFAKVYDLDEIQRNEAAIQIQFRGALGLPIGMEMGTADTPGETGQGNDAGE